MQSRLRSASGLFSCRESKETWHGLCPCIPALPGVWSARSVAPNSRWPQPGVRDCTDRAVYLCPLVGRTHTHTHTHTHKHTHTNTHTVMQGNMEAILTRKTLSSLFQLPLPSLALSGQLPLPYLSLQVAASESSFQVSKVPRLPLM